MPKIQISIRITDDARAFLDDLTVSTGLSQAGVIELGIRELAKKFNMKTLPIKRRYQVVCKILQQEDVLSGEVIHSLGCVDVATGQQEVRSRQKILDDLIKKKHTYYVLGHAGHEVEIHPNKTEMNHYYLETVPDRQLLGNLENLGECRRTPT